MAHNALSIEQNVPIFCIQERPEVIVDRRNENVYVTYQAIFAL